MHLFFLSPNITQIRIDRYRITTLLLVPSIVHQLVNSPKAKKADLSSVVFIASGAAYLPDSLSKRMIRMAPNVGTSTVGEGPYHPYHILADIFSQFNLFIEGYGMSEATLSVTSKPVVEGLLGGRAKIVPGSAGVLLPGYEVRLVRTNGTEAGINEPGELWVRGPTVSIGYWNNEQANKETFVDGWLKTGDMFMVDQDGVFYFQDRAKVRVSTLLCRIRIWD